jgi:hypothetical protein
MSDVLSQFEEQQAQTIAQSMQFQRWSLVMILLMIQEQEQRLLSSDLPVDTGEDEEDFWAEGL